MLLLKDVTRQASLSAEQFKSWLAEDVAEKDHNKAWCQYYKNTTDSYSMCIGMEFLYAHNFHQDLLQLLKKNKASLIKNNQDWARFFELTLAFDSDSLSFSIIYQQLNVITTNDPALKAFISALKISLQLMHYNFTWVGEELEDFRDKTYQVSHPILRPFVLNRLEKILFFYHWKRNDMLLARKYGFNLLTRATNHLYLAELNVNLSLTYIFDDFNSASFHLEEAYRIATTLKVDRLINMIEQRNRPFIYAHFNKPEGIVTNDRNEQAHLALVRGNLHEVERLLADIKDHTPFTKYFLGRARQDRHLLQQSYNEFIEQRSDYFFARLPLNILKELSS
ncbi:hypothetical protein SAMN04488134_102256 [Amphibacillus marinus]|uniref:Uncharacterized protein n=1 Tax=Amphibacillus marinus TaxID=872970 RepID=A0A1H8KEB4_9BACI|nr:AimR family lysis-lysogeny pheromone receptor [Amphibacillus marinus]SEN91011.1 hypothetical protein SAMN04488134_102256 [Amphibacillus marinus]